MAKIAIGDRASVSKSFGSEEVEHFAAISLDRNPIHLDAEFAAQTVFGRRIVHGVLVASLFSGLLGQELPGPGTVYLGQELRFTRPVFVGEEVTASVEVIHIREDKPIVTLKTECRNAQGEVVIEGQAVVKI